MNNIKDMYSSAQNLMSFYNRPAVQIARDLRKGYNDFPFSFRNMMSKYGNETIRTIVIVRNPLNNLTKSLLNMVTFGEMERRMKTQPYEDFFHLKIIVNNKYSIEKEQVIKFTLNREVKQDAETLVVQNIPSGVTINQMLERTKQAMGSLMFSYNFKTNNCQVFVSSLLKSIGINNPQYHQFINQNVASVFKDMSISRKIINTSTDIGNRANFLIEGRGIEEDENTVPQRIKKYKKLTTLSSSEIYNLLKLLDLTIVKNRIFMKDEISDPLQEGFYFMNLQNNYQNGSHWTVFLKDKQCVYYADSFGVFPPENQFQLFKSNNLKIYYNEQQNQNIDATSCGFWALAFMYFMKNEKGSLLSKFKNFNKMFTKDNSIKNEKTLLEYINKILQK